MHDAYTLRLEVAMVDRDAVEAFASIIGIGVVRPHRRREANHQNQWRWSVAGGDAIEAGERLRPYLCSRRLARLNEVLAKRAAWIEDATHPRDCPTCGVTFRPPWGRGVRKRVYCSDGCRPWTQGFPQYKREWRAQRRAKGLPVT